MEWLINEFKAIGYIIIGVAFLLIGAFISDFFTGQFGKKKS